MERAEKQRTYYRANRKKCLAYSREWAKRNRAKCRAANRDYLHRNPGMAAACKARRRSRESRMTARQIQAEMARLREQQRGLCCYCRRPGLKLTLEHRTPVKLGGGNEPQNLALACQSCNSKKGALTAAEFIGWG